MAEEAQNGGEKTEAPTPKKLLDSAKKGDVLQSRDLGGAIVIFVGTVGILMFGNMLFQALADMLTSALIFDQKDVEVFDIGERSFSLVFSLTTEFMTLFIALLVGSDRWVTNVLLVVCFLLSADILFAELGFFILSLKLYIQKKGLFCLIF